MCPTRSEPPYSYKGLFGLLADEIGEQADLKKRLSLNNESDRLAKLVDEVLTLSRIETGREDFILTGLIFQALIRIH
jgi:signal transduction histidine kinase